MIRVNLLGLPKPKKRAPMVVMDGARSAVLLVIVLLVVGAAQFFRYNRLQAEQKRLTKLVADETAEKARLELVRAEYDKFAAQKALLTKRINIIEGLKAKQAGPSRLLQTIASTVSNTDMLWLTLFEQAGQKVTIEGAAMSPKAVADFLTQLKDSKAFSDVDLKETYQDNTVKELQKFVFTVNGELVAPAPTT
jgi:Tfp pilus assembly protein PilN